MVTIYRLFNDKAKAWWHHAALRKSGHHIEARAKERETIKRLCKSLRLAQYVSVGRGGHSVHERTTTSPSGMTSKCTVQGYESINGPTVKAAIRLGIPVIDTTTVSDARCYDLISLPMPAESDDKADSIPYHGMSYCPLGYYAALARALGATVYNLKIDAATAQAELASYMMARDERRAQYAKEEAECKAAAARADSPVAFKFPATLHIPRRSGSDRKIQRLGDLCATLAESEGYESFSELIQHRGHDSCVPGICWICRFYTTDVEPDQVEGYCENCGENSVISALEFATRAEYLEMHDQD